jgi:hypothetical protein
LTDCRFSPKKCRHDSSQARSHRVGLSGRFSGVPHASGAFPRYPHVPALQDHPARCGSYLTFPCVPSRP